MAETKTSKDGIVTRDGEIIGRVIRGEKSVGIAQEIMGTKSVVWDSVDENGNVLDTHTRKRDAIARVIRNAQPLTFSNIEFKIDSWTGQPYISAKMEFKGHTFFVTRFPVTESHWVVDSYFSANSVMPVWSNGEATRVTAAHILRDDYADKLNAAVEAHA